MSLKKGDRLPLEYTVYSVALVFRRKDDKDRMVVAAHTEVVGGRLPLEEHEVKARAERSVAERWGEYTASGAGDDGIHERWELFLWNAMATHFGPKPESS